MSTYHIETDKGTYEVEVADTPQQSQPEPKAPDLASSLYHGAIEGGAMGVGGAAGAILGSPGGPVGSGLGAVGVAAAMYPPAKRFAEGIDRMRGITPPASPGVATEFGQGVEMEAAGMALKPVLGAASTLLPGAKTGEALSGTPASNLSRAYKQGFPETYLAPNTLKQAGEDFGAAKLKMVGQILTPEEQVAMMVNPKGEANQKVADVMTKWLKGEPVSAEEALAARQATDTIFPPDTARRAVQRGGLSDFKTAMNQILAEKNPDMKAASDAYAASKLRSDLLKPFRVNKSNPEQYSKLGAMLNAMGGVGHGIASAVGMSPLGMGLISSTAGSIAKNPEVTDAVRRAALASFIDKYTTKRNP